MYLHSPTVQPKYIVRLFGYPLIQDSLSRREYDGDEVEAVKLFLTSDDEVAAALGFESSS